MELFFSLSTTVTFIDFVVIHFTEVILLHTHFHSSREQRTGWIHTNMYTKWILWTIWQNKREKIKQEEKTNKKAHLVTRPLAPSLNGWYHLTSSIKRQVLQCFVSLAGILMWKLQHGFHDMPCSRSREGGTMRGEHHKLTTANQEKTKAQQDRCLLYP